MTRWKLTVLLMTSLSACAFPAANPVTVVFNRDNPGSAVSPKLMNGTCLPVWNSASLYRDIRSGLVTGHYTLMRFPNGSLSNDYHWNGNGSYDLNGIWTCDSTMWQPGFVSQITYRGTSKNHYGFMGVSCITDGDTATYWWSDPAIRRIAPYFYVEFSPGENMDSLVIVWGNLYGIDFIVQRWSATAPFYPGPHQAVRDQWETIDSVVGNTKRIYSAKLAASVFSPYYRVLVAKSYADSLGVQVAEFTLYDKGVQISRNQDSYTASGGQTRVIALPTHPGSSLRTDYSSLKWDFATFMAYCDSFPYTVDPVICVNYGTGTPREAARWVYYANVVKKHDIRFWQIGNEMDGAWEEGGPLSAAMYAHTFIEFSRAMKAVDPSIKIFGPVLSNADFSGLASGEYNGKGWMETFLEIVGGHERTDQSTYLDGIDFHSYPYFFSGAPSRTTMLAKSDYVYSNSDTLLSMIENYLPNADSVLIFLSEYNSSGVMSNLLQEPINGICLANMYAAYVEKFGWRGMAVVWDSFEALNSGPNGTWGSNSLFTNATGQSTSTWAKPPSAIYWSLFMAGNLWLNPSAALQQYVAATYDRASGLRAYGAASANDFRAMLINVSAETLAVSCGLSDHLFATADVYRWGEQEFRWIGTDASAYASPNCGPSSKRYAVDSLQSIVLPPAAFAIVDYHKTVSASSAPRLLYRDYAPGRLRSGDTLALWGTVLDSVNCLAHLSYSIDSLASQPLTPLDGAVDGLSECFLLSIPATALSPGNHTITLFARNIAGGAVTDTVVISTAGRLRPTILIDDFQDENLISALPTRAQWGKYHQGTPQSNLVLSFDQDTGFGSSMRADFSLIQPASLGYTTYAAFYLDLDTVLMDTIRPKIIGITFRYASTHSSSLGTFGLQVQSNPVSDFNFYKANLNKTNGAWRDTTLLWEDFVQESWGQIAEPLANHAIHRLEFRMVQEGEGIFEIDNVAFISDSGSAINLGAKGRAGKNLLAHGLHFQQLPGSGVVFTWNSLKNGAPGTISIYNGRGRLIHSSALQKQQIRYHWNQLDARGKRVAPGLYIARIEGTRTLFERTFFLLR